MEIRKMNFWPFHEFMLMLILFHLARTGETSVEKQKFSHSKLAKISILVFIIETVN